MVRKLIAPLLAAALFAGLLAVALAGPAHSAATLPKLTPAALTPADLIVKMAAELPGTQSVHGTFTWTNGLLGSQSLRLPAGASCASARFTISGETVRAEPSRSPPPASAGSAKRVAVPLSDR